MGHPRVERIVLMNPFSHDLAVFLVIPQQCLVDNLAGPVVPFDTLVRQPCSDAEVPAGMRAQDIHEQEGGGTSLSLYGLFLIQGQLTRVTCHRCGARPTIPEASG